MALENPEISAESTLTDRYQTTIPALVRKALGLSKGDKLQFLLDETGGIRLAKQKPKEPEHSDPALAAFLDLLSKDIDKNPHKLRELDDTYWARIDKLTEGVEVDLNESLDYSLDVLLSDDDNDRA